MRSAVFKPFPKQGPSLCRHSCRGTCCAAAAAAGGRQADAGRAVWSHACAPVSAHSCQHASWCTCTLRHGQTCIRRQQWVSAPHIPLILSQRSMVLRNWVRSGACHVSALTSHRWRKLQLCNRVSNTDCSTTEPLLAVHVSARICILEKAACSSEAAGLARARWQGDAVVPQTGMNELTAAALLQLQASISEAASVTEMLPRSRLGMGMRLEDEMMLTPQDEALRRTLAEKSFMAAAAEVHFITVHGSIPMQEKELPDMERERATQDTGTAPAPQTHAHDAASPPPLCIALTGCVGLTICNSA